MKKPRKSATVAAPAPMELKLEDSIPDPIDPVGFNSNADLCQQLFDRYSASSAPQHRHLYATAAAMRAMLLDDSLPLTPLSYFAATINALSHSSDDADGVGALSTFLSILLPLVPDGSIAPGKAVQAVEILVGILNRPEREKKEATVGTSSVKCLVKCLGVLLGFCNLEDWESVRLPVETLLSFSMDKRPKVRKVAQVCLQKALQSFQSPTAVKKTSKLVLSLLETHISSAIKVGPSKTTAKRKANILPELENLEAFHVLNATKIVIPHLCGSISLKVVSKLLGLLKSPSSIFVRPTVEIVDEFLENFSIEYTSQIAEEIINSLSSHVSLKESDKEAVVPIAKLLGRALEILRIGGTSKWIKSFPVVARAIASLLTHDKAAASLASDILKDLIDHQMGRTTVSGAESQAVHEEFASDLDSRAVSSTCSIFEDLLETCAGVPNEYTLSVLSVLFLKLGVDSVSHMRGILLKLVELMKCIDTDIPEKSDRLQRCIGCAIVAMGPENVLELVPVSFDADNLTCLNTWLLPLLRKYITGASLGYFIEYIVPMAESVEKASCLVKKSVIRQDLQAHARGLWGLLPAFCHCPTDLASKFESLVKLIMTLMEKNSLILEDIATALKDLVSQNHVCKPKDSVGEPLDDLNKCLLDDSLLKTRSVPSYTKKVVKKNIRALSAGAKVLLPALTDMFLNESTEKCSYVKEAIRCLALISDSSSTSEIFVSALEKFELIDIKDGTRNFELIKALLDENSVSLTNKSERCLIFELASLIIEGADKDLVGVIYWLTKQFLQAGDAKYLPLAYHTLRQILEEHPWICSSQFDEIVDMILDLKAALDVDALRSRLNCLDVLLVHDLKEWNNSQEENTKAFLILNEIILLSKDSKEEVRKTAYDALLKISSNLSEPSCFDPDGPYYKLINMMMGYLSTSSPHIISGAISALSVLIYKDPSLCSSAPELVSSITTLLLGKSVEVVKATLGFLKVLVSCLEAKDLQNHLTGIVEGVMPWSSVSRHHFREKVTVILEIMVRKCGPAPVQQVTPERYNSFLRNVLKNRHGKPTTKEADSNATKPEPANSGFPKGFRQRKRMQNETSNEEGGFSKRVKQHHPMGCSENGAHFSAGSAKPGQNSFTRPKMGRDQRFGGSAKPGQNSFECPDIGRDQREKPGNFKKRKWTPGKPPQKQFRQANSAQVDSMRNGGKSPNRNRKFKRKNQ